MMQRILLGVTLAAFLAQTVVVLSGIGVAGLLASINFNDATRLTFVDLVIALVLITVWMRMDAKATGRPFWPFVVVTLFFGSAGPLVYLLVRTLPSQCPVPTATAAVPREPRA